MSYELYLKRAESLLNWYESGYMGTADYWGEIMKLMRQHKDDIKKYRMEVYARHEQELRRLDETGWHEVY